MPARISLPLDDFYQGRLLVFGHRGAREQAPENTLPAFARAAEIGADGVELDVQLSLDGAPVVMHDFTVERTTNGSGEVSKMTLAALRELDAGATFSGGFAGARIPTLDEVFEAVGTRVLVNVELKAFGMGRAARDLVGTVARSIHVHGMSKRVILSSFNPLILGMVRRIAPELPVGYLYAPDLPLPLAKGWMARPLIGRHEARHPHFSMVDDAYMRWAHRREYRVNVWTVNEAEDVRRMRDLGVDAIISDRPDSVLSDLRGEV